MHFLTLSKTVQPMIFVVCFVIGLIVFNLYFNDIFKIKNKFLNTYAQS